MARVKARLALIDVDPLILSSYPVQSPPAPRNRLLGLRAIGVGRGTPDMAAALLGLHDAVLARGGDLRVTDCLRSVQIQREARDKYLRWLDAGKPLPSDASFRPDMKPHFVAPPGYSFHGAGRAIDIHVDALRFPDVAKHHQLDTLWEIARPLGWRPVIRQPIEGASEAWHFDYLGPWAPALDRLGYADTAVCAHLDIGLALYERSPQRAVQAQLHRAGYDCGVVDGFIGAKTRKCLRAAGADEGTQDASKLFWLESSPVVVFRP